MTLRETLKKNTEDYINKSLLEVLPEGYKIIGGHGNTVSDDLSKLILRDYESHGLKKKIGRLVFRDYDIEGVISLVDEEKERVKGIFTKYFLEHRDWFSKKED